MSIYSDILKGVGSALLGTPSAGTVVNKGINKVTSTPTSKPSGGSSGGGGYTPSSSGSGYTGGSSTVKNNPYVTGKDDAGDTDWSVLLNSAMGSGASAEEVQRLLEQRTQKALDKGYTQYAYDDVYRAAQNYINANQAPKNPYQFGSLEELRDALGYNEVSAAEQAAIDAYIKQTVNGLESQKSSITQSADEAARQAYISYMQSQAALPQALAASGYSGGMADSQRLALDTTLQNNQKDILLGRDNALNDVDTAIQQAKLEGSIQGAQAQAQLGRDAIAAYQQYIQQQNDYAHQDFWNKYGYDWQAGQNQQNQQWQSGESQKDRDWQSGESQADRDYNTGVTTQKQAYESAWNMLLAGAVPDDDTLAAAGISRAEAEAVAALVKQQNAGKAGGGSGNGTVVPALPSDTQPQAGGVTQEQYNAAADRFESGDYSQSVIDTMLAAGDSPDALAAAAGFTADLTKLMYGPLSESKLAQLVASGEIQGLTIGNRTYYRRTGGTKAAGMGGLFQ